MLCQILISLSRELISVIDEVNTNKRFSRLPEIMISAVGNELMTLAITFLTNSEYIKNPYLKAKLVSLLFHGTWPVYHRNKGVIGDALIGEKFANDNLLHALMKFYIGKLCISHFHRDMLMEL
jgi:ubiquitin conjugation factor E4 B